MKEKEHRLLLLLIQNQDRYITSKELSEQLSLSERTIRTYLHNFEQIMMENGAEIIAKQGYGFQLHIIQFMRFEIYLNQMKAYKITSNKDSVVLDTVMDRQIFILNKLFIENEHVILESLTEQLYISRSTLTNEINAIKALLKPYSLHMVSKPNRGTWIEGEEANKRAFIIHYFFQASHFNSLQEYMNYMSCFDDISVEKFIMIILDECQRNKIKLSDVMIQNVLLHLLLSIKRIEKGLAVHLFPVDDAFLDSVEYRTAKQIIQRLNTELKIHFPESEIIYLTLHLGAKNNHTPDDNDSLVDQTESELNEVLKDMETDSGIPFTKDVQLRKSLLEHLFPLLLRLQHKIKMKNPLTTEIMHDYNDIFNLTKTHFSKLSGLYQKAISDDEWAYIVLHFMASMEKQREGLKLQVLVICSTGFGSAQLLKARIEKAFKDIHVVDTLGYFEIYDEALQGIDLIISSVDLNAVLFHIPFLHVSVFLNEADKQCIRAFIDSYVSGKSQALPHIGITESSPRKLEIFNRYFQHHYFRLIHEEISQIEVVKLLLKVLSNQEKPSFIEHMMQQIQLRSSLGSVVFSQTVAVPHPAIPIGNKACIGIAVIPHGLKWNHEYPSIKFVFLLSPSCVSDQKMRIMMQAMIAFIDRLDLQEELIQNPTFDRFQKIFLSLM